MQDKIEIVQEIDKSNMIDDLINCPNQLSNALAISRKNSLRFEKYVPETALVIGMGGSGIGGDIARVIAEKSNNKQVIVLKNYEIPSYVNEKTITIAVSYSGNTEETMSAVQKARKKTGNVICVASGGKLSNFAKRHNFPLLKIPSGLQPRSALGYLTVPVLAALEDNGFMSNLEVSIAEAAAQLKEQINLYRPENKEYKNPAKRMARDLSGKIPVIYGGVGIGEVAAKRWKAQLNENSCIPAFTNVIPELNHNEINGWELTENFEADYALILMYDKQDNKRITKRLELTNKILKEHMKVVHKIKSNGETVLSRILSLTILGDFVSYYLAILNEIDPTPVKTITNFKDLMVD